MGVSAVVEPSLCVPSGDEMVGTEHSPLLEQQEDEEVKVRQQRVRIAVFSVKCLMSEVLNKRSERP